MWTSPLSVDPVGDSDAFNKTGPHFCQRLSTKSRAVIQDGADRTTREGWQPASGQPGRDHTHLPSPQLRRTGPTAGPDKSATTGRRRLQKLKGRFDATLEERMTLGQRSNARRRRDKRPRRLVLIRQKEGARKSFFSLLVMQIPPESTSRKPR